MCGFRRWNSGEAWYLVNSEDQSSAERGGREPVTGFHSVMLSLCLGKYLTRRRGLIGESGGILHTLTRST
jgi:hypothetical protein